MTNVTLRIRRRPPALRVWTQLFGRATRQARIQRMNGLPRLCLRPALLTRLCRVLEALRVSKAATPNSLLRTNA